ncbi:MAG TPA: phosphoribosyltransferase family protein [Thermodesulfobacteriota bacterium]|jgi:predicted phosphoribosyltransferase|nr:phosphoribosyltransferase family protein [Thermodesulfobacteriota bacterium]
METIAFGNRRDAGRRLARALMKRGYRGVNTLVLGIPRGGLVVADEVAKTLSASLDIVIARRLRAPYQPELGIGAVVDGDHILLNEEQVRTVGASRDYLNHEIAFQKEEVERWSRFYRDGRPAPEVAGKTVILVDDGIATGYTFRASLESVRRRRPGRLVAATPVAARDSAEMLKAFADEVVCLSIPASFLAVGAWYRNFDQVSDEEAAAILRRNWSRWPLAA